MESNNNKEQQNIRKAQLMASRQRYYSRKNRTDEFSTLPGHIQRSIEREANFQLDSMVKSNAYAPFLDKETAEELFKAHCEYYAHIGLEQQKINPYNTDNLFNRLLERDSQANLIRNISSHQESFDNKTTRRAANIDRDFEKSSKATSSNNPQEHIQQMLLHKRIRTI